MICGLLALGLLQLSARAQTTGPSLGLPLQPPEKKPAFVTRGDEVEDFYKAYTAKLAAFHDELQKTLKSEAPDLYRKLNPAAPRPVPYGYGLLPVITKDPPSNERRDTPRATSTPYSWRRTRQFIEAELPSLDSMAQQLAGTRKVPPKERHAVYERLVKDYPQLEDNQRLVDIHIQYNRFWQDAISKDRARFDRLTRMHDAVLERQSIADTLAEERLVTPEKKEVLLEREKKLAALIHAQSDNFKAAPYVRVTHPKEHVWQVNVPLCTDITDRAYVRKLQNIFESVWRVEDKADTFKVKVELRQLSPASLYKGHPPKTGSHIDASEHARHFPKDCGVLTTGVNSTYAIPDRFVALAAQPISYNVMAHEFGHLLGFVDGYFRGYRDLGDEGFEVLEVVPDPDDIMCTPGLGHVRRHHFEKLISGSKPATPPAPAQ